MEIENKLIFLDIHVISKLPAIQNILNIKLHNFLVCVNLKTGYVFLP
jgi:hypothetical protein